MKFDVKTDWSKWEVAEDISTYYFERLDTPEVGCDGCLGYASWQVQEAGDPAGYGVLICANCLAESANDPTFPGTFIYHP